MGLILLQMMDKIWAQKPAYVIDPNASNKNTHWMFLLLRREQHTMGKGKGIISVGSRRTVWVEWRNVKEHLGKGPDNRSMFGGTLSSLLWLALKLLERREEKNGVRIGKKKGQKAKLEPNEEDHTKALKRHF